MSVERMRSQPISMPRQAAGMTLIELMIALVLGLMVLSAAIGIFLSNRQTYRATDNLGRLQETARVAFELMAHDIREAGGNACNRGLPTANVLNNPAAQWFTDWSSPVRGYDDTMVFAGAGFGTGAAARVNGTDALELKSGTSTGATVVSHNPSSAQFQVNTVNHGLDDGDLAIICDNREAAVFQITNAQPGTNVTIVHNTGNSVSPGNSTKSLGIPLGTDYRFGPNSIIIKLHATAWYVGNNGRGSRSLYQETIVNSSGATSGVAQEVVEGVTDMQITYLPAGTNAYVAASAVADWSTVSAVRVDLTLVSPENIGADGAPLMRHLIHVVTLRNRTA